MQESGELYSLQAACVKMYPQLADLLQLCVYVCVFVARSQASTGPQAKQDGLREEVEEAWRKLESIKVRVPELE